LNPHANVFVPGSPLVVDKKSTESKEVVETPVVDQEVKQKPVYVVQKTPLTEQLEFYLSDRNLSRDRYLVSIMIANDDTIPIFTFMEFPKIQKYTKKIEGVKAAIRKSELLELVKDGHAVRRADGVGAYDLKRKPRLDHYGFQNQIDFISKNVEVVDNQKKKYRIDLSGDDWASNYHKEYTKFCDDATKKATLVQNYIEGMVWVLDYYINGINDWTWFFADHYPPLLIDFVHHIPENLENITIPHNEAVLPSIQLLSVLPPASGRDHLPECLTQIYENPKIKEYYPDEYEIDYSGCVKSFQAKVCLPFIPAELLKELVSEVDERTEEEKNRDKEGKEMEYSCTFYSGEFHPTCTGGPKSLIPKGVLLTLGTAVACGLLLLKVCRLR